MWVSGISSRRKSWVDFLCRNLSKPVIMCRCVYWAFQVHGIYFRKQHRAIHTTRSFDGNSGSNRYNIWTASAQTVYILCILTFVFRSLTFAFVLCISVCCYLIFTVPFVTYIVARRHMGFICLLILLHVNTLYRAHTRSAIATSWIARKRTDLTVCHF